MFNYAFARMQIDLRRELTAAGCIQAMPLVPGKLWTSDGDVAETLQVYPPPFMDDFVLPLPFCRPDELTNHISTATLTLDRITKAHGLNINMAVGKTECVFYAV